MDALKRFKNGDVIISIVEWCQDETLRELNRQRLINVEYHGIGFRRLILTPAGQWKLLFEGDE